ncbi:MAG: LPS export ABC transporter periplasmic protein LptC [Acidobacteria bacterium]|nr:LPS export ABC transporter periplasmic protein LptC [Acidobacteriota bacterium]
MHKSLITWLRRLSVLMSCTVILVVGYYFFSRNGSVPDEESQREPLTSDVTSATREIEYLQTRDGAPLFRLKASRNIATVQGVNHLQDVEVVYYGPTGERRDTIHADECFYSVSENQVRFQENIIIRLAAGYQIRTRELLYEKSTDMAVSDGPFTFASDGITGSGNGFALNLKDREMAIREEVRFRYTTPAGRGRAGLAGEQSLELEAGAALLQENAGVIHLGPEAVIRSDRSRLSARNMDVFLTEERTLRRLLCQGEARYNSRQAERTISLTGAELEFRMAEAPVYPEEIVARDQARLQLAEAELAAQHIAIRLDAGAGITAVEADERVLFAWVAAQRTIAGESLVLRFSDGGLIEEVRVTGNAQLRQQGEQATYQLSAGQLLFFLEADATGATRLDRVQALEKSLLNAETGAGDVLSGRADALQIDYDEAGAFPTAVLATGNSRWSYMRKEPREDLFLECRRLAVKFVPGTSEPESFEAEEDIYIRRSWSDDQWLESWCRRMSGRNAGTVAAPAWLITQRQDVRFRSAQLDAQAEKATLQKDVITLTENPVIRTPEAETHAETFTLAMPANEVTGEGSIQTIFRKQNNGHSPRLLPWGGDTAGNEPVYVHARRMIMKNSQGMAVYRDNCRMVQGNNTLTAAEFTLDQRQNTFRATGGVVVLYSLKTKEQGQPEKQTPVEIRARDLTYTAADRQIVLEGTVRARTNRGDLVAERMWGFFEPEQGLRSLYAAVDIRITQATREAEGDRAKLHLPQGDIILVGNPARVIDKQEGRTTQGLRLTLFAENDRILIENEDKPLK